MKHVIEDMKQYYKERASEYEEWYDRKNRYDKGEELNKLWFKNIELLKDYTLSIKGHSILELASGTGKWTQFLIKNNKVLAVDNSNEMLEINRARSGVEGIKQDIFSLSIDNPNNYDACFFGFWLSHVPENQLDEFFQTIKKSLAKNARVIIFDSYLNQTELNCLKYEDNVQDRALNNGKVFKVYKKYYTKEELENLIGNRYFKEYKITLTPEYFYIFDGILE